MYGMANSRVRLYQLLQSVSCKFDPFLSLCSLNITIYLPRRSTKFKKNWKRSEKNGNVLNKKPILGCQIDQEALVLAHHQFKCLTMVHEAHWWDRSWSRVLAALVPTWHHHQCLETGCQTRPVTNLINSIRINRTWQVQALNYSGHSCRWARTRSLGPNRICEPIPLVYNPDNPVVSAWVENFGNEKWFVFWCILQANKGKVCC